MHSLSLPIVDSKRFDGSHQQQARSKRRGIYLPHVRSKLASKSELARPQGDRSLRSQGFQVLRL